MKALKIGIRFWITITSVLSFLMGWIMLAHAPKPGSSVFTNILAPLPTLQPLSPLQDEGSFQSQPFFSTQPGFRSQFRPAFRTGGS